MSASGQKRPFCAAVRTAAARGEADAGYSVRDKRKRNPSTSRPRIAPPTAKRPKAKKEVHSVYAELGYPNPDEMAIKAQLVTRVGDTIKRRKLTQKEAAGIMGMTQAKVSQMLRGQFRDICQAKLLACLAALGNNVEIRPSATRPERGERDLGSP